MLMPIRPLVSLLSVPLLSLPLCASRLTPPCLSQAWQSHGHAVGLVTPRGSETRARQITERLLSQSAARTANDAQLAGGIGQALRQAGVYPALIVLDHAAAAQGTRGGSPWRLALASAATGKVLAVLTLGDGEVMRIMSGGGPVRQAVLYDGSGAASVTPADLSGRDMRRVHRLIAMPLLVEMNDGTLWASPRLLRKVTWQHPEQPYRLLQAVCHMSAVRS
ncbi:MAG: hypothetical protein JO171_02275 [Paludibacterium sp.]|uniref:hypothetical protein n=1 Tax=Paludibacterium sp. TaxID=1917523 RepID=UPI0025E0690D|nr:hypothetical protein [Paludibacterium sp.]MBV8045951.1 hypothetical protein [Paludibacterium sp.]MBV8646125.1 hypothetical protein [Paludibacterium sp.]